MQNIIDLVAEKIMADFAGMILLWSGAVVDIPSGWVLCDGANGSPDLTDRFVQGAGDSFAPGATGGDVAHTHTFTGDGHTHDMLFNGSISSGDGFNDLTDSGYSSGTTDSEDHIPPYYSLAYIFKT